MINATINLAERLGKTVVVAYEYGPHVRFDAVSIRNDLMADEVLIQVPKGKAPSFASDLVNYCPPGTSAVLQRGGQTTVLRSGNPEQTDAFGVVDALLTPGAGV